MLTAFGIACRKLRLDRGLSLRNFAAGLGLSSTFVSALETGKKSIPWGYVAKTMVGMSLSQEEAWALRIAADRTRVVVRVDGLSADQRELVAAFARGVDRLPEALAAEVKRAITRPLWSGQSPGGPV